MGFNLKRLFDLLLSITTLIVLSPLIIFLIILNFVKIGRPIFFIQKRPGLNEKPFNLIKFRTMDNIYDFSGNLLSDDSRINKFGMWIRTYSLDELPQLINVIKGEMSLVGPRPLLIEYLDLYDSEQKKRHNVLPGITGWSQINGRNAITWEEKLSHDIWYVENQSIFLDIKIILITIKKIIRRENINPKNQLSMPKFKGKKNE